MDKYGLVGYPLGHSFSKNYFNDKFLAEKIDAEYFNFEISNINDFPHILEQHPELKGMNVTIPYKQAVMEYLDITTAEARAIGAVNVIRVDHSKRTPSLIGYNSDVIGFVRSIEPLIRPHHKKALILGTGGASKAIQYGLEKKLGLETMFVSRSRKDNCITYTDITPEVMKEYEVIVNCTPKGMFPHTDECPDIPYELLSPSHLLYDLVYNPEETMFMKNGKKYGAMVKNGLEMLILQAIASWEFWNE